MPSARNNMVNNQVAIKGGSNPENPKALTTEEPTYKINPNIAPQAIYNMLLPLRK